MGLIRSISYERCVDIGPLPSDEINLDRDRSHFILMRKVRSLAGQRRLGVAWLVLDPVAVSLVFLFVFTVINASIRPESLFIGRGLYGIFRTSFKSGADAVKDFSGGLKSERVRTRVLTASLIKYRLLDNTLQSVGVAAVLFFGLGTNIEGTIAFMISAQILGFMAEGFALNLALFQRRVPDFSNIVTYFLLVMFFGSPALYPMSSTSGLHYRVNEFNPFTYFAEATRHYAKLDSVVFDIDPLIMISITSIVIIFSFRGFSLLDRLRWEVSSWS